MAITYNPAGITFGSVLEEITSNLQGYSAAPDQVTAISKDVGLTDISIGVDDASILGRGLIEVGSELMWVQQVDPSANLAALLPKGRGWRGSTATTHLKGDTVVVSPSIPRYVIAREINNHIRSLYPDVYAVQTTEFAYNSVLKLGWGIPDEAVAILDVRWKDFRNNWQRIRTWEAENGADLTDFPTGRCVRFRGIPVGRTVQIVYAVTPTTLLNETDLFTSSGLSESAKDLVVLGTMARVIPNLDTSRLSVQYAAADEMGQARPQGGAIAVAKFVQQQYMARLRAERTILNVKYPARIHFTR